MKDESETKQQLVAELAALCQRLAESEVEETGRLRAVAGSAAA